MAKVTGPLLSLSASGTIADAITYVCGKFARGKEQKGGEMEQPAQLRGQGERFIEGAKVWKSMSEGGRESWRRYIKVFTSSPECVGLGYKITSYNLYMSYYLRFEEGGWDNYPEAPA